MSGEGAAKHTPEWLDELAGRLQQSEAVGADGVAYALEWAAADIRQMEKRLATMADSSRSTIVGLKVELARLDNEIRRVRELASQEEGAWS